MGQHLVAHHMQGREPTLHIGSNRNQLVCGDVQACRILLQLPGHFQVGTRFGDVDLFQFVKGKTEPFQPHINLVPFLDRGFDHNPLQTVFDQIEVIQGIRQHTGGEISGPDLGNLLLTGAIDIVPA